MVRKTTPKASPKKGKKASPKTTKGKKGEMTIAQKHRARVDAGEKLKGASLMARKRASKTANEYTRSGHLMHAIPSASFRRVARLILKDMAESGGDKDAARCTRISDKALEVLHVQMEKNIENLVIRARNIMGRVDKSRGRKTLMRRYLEIVDDIRESEDPMLI